MSNKVTLALASVLSIGISAGYFSAWAHGDHFSSIVNNDGEISFPTDFRKNMVHIGSWFVPEGGASGFHDVYTERQNLEAYQKDGKFPDGTTLVKELRAHDTGDYTTGEGVSHSTDGLKQWFVMIKDSEGRFPKNTNWGKGWGWALFKPDAKDANASTDYEADCIGCHIPAEATDYVYIEAYPILKE